MLWALRDSFECLIVLYGPAEVDSTTRRALVDVDTPRTVTHHSGRGSVDTKIALIRTIDPQNGRHFRKRARRVTRDMACVHANV